jgi:predicted transglutaminase-like cysteine proteinase
MVNAAMGIATLMLGLLGAGFDAEAASAVKLVYAPVGDSTSVPAGYLQFCRDNRSDCAAEHEEARDVVLSKTAWRDLKLVNDRVNRAIEPMTDEDNYGVAEYWSYPLNGRGDCEDYALLKRKLLIDAGWPRSALLVTVVRDKKGDGHAVLMVKTDRGEFVLDNQEGRILPWQDTGYRYIKRQSQEDQNVWVSLGDTQTTSVVAAGAE